MKNSTTISAVLVFMLFISPVIDMGQQDSPVRTRLIF